MVPSPSLSVDDPAQPAAPTPLEAWLDRLVTPLLVDERDVVFTRNLARLLPVIPLSLAIFLAPPWLSLVLGAIYLPWLMARWAGPYVLMVHAIAHRPLFRRPWRGLDKIVALYAPWFGVPASAYHPHHVVMHHRENNGLEDLSSTAGYRRDSPLHFAHYLVRFAVFGHLHLGVWLARRHHYKALATFVVGELVYAAVVVTLLVVDPVATAVVFVAPYVMLRYFLMAGNWGQHAFVDADEPTNSFRNSTCLLNTRYNERCYNDGYHIVHHRTPGLHWADMPARFLRDLPKYAEQDAIVFDGVANNQQIWWCLMRGDYGYLADRLVDLGRGRTREEKIELLKERVQRQGEPLRGLLELREALA